MANAKQIEEQIIRARVRMLLKAPFFGNLATRLKLVDGSDWIPTAATDGKHLYYNVDFFSKLDKKETEFVVAHEVMHCVYDHMTRRGSRDPRLWNCAGDYIINWELDQQKIGRMPTFIQCLYDPKYANQAAEEIYESLKQDQEDGKGDDKMDSFDTHLDPDQGKKSGAGEDGEGEAGSDPTGKGGQIPMSEDERAVIGDEIKQAVMQAAKVAGAGNCPAGVKRLLKDLTEPQMDWREILNCQIQSALKADYTFARPNRKSWASGIYLPGNDNDFKLEVAIAIDTSGSISERMLRDFLGEIQGIMEQFLEFEITLWCFDTAVHNPQKFTSDNLDEICEYDIQGGGGTEFDVNWDYMKDVDLDPNRLIVMTDGYPWSSWGDENYCDTVFLVHGNKSIVAPFGMTCYYDEAAK